MQQLRAAFIARGCYWGRPNAGMRLARAQAVVPGRAGAQGAQKIAAALVWVGSQTYAKQNGWLQTQAEACARRS